LLYGSIKYYADTEKGNATNLDEQYIVSNGVKYFIVKYTNACLPFRRFRAKPNFYNKCVSSSVIPRTTE
jgi:hypothetical protein